VSGTPASAIAPAVKVMNVNGIALRKPPMRSIDWAPPIAPITEPAPMKSSALKKAWVIRWKRPDAYANAETPSTM
jgi:hypothetical protein